MDTKGLIDELNSMKDNFPDLIVKEIRVSSFNCVYIVTSDSVSSGDKVNDFILKYFSNKSIHDDFSFSNISKSINNFIPSINLKSVNDNAEFFNYLFSGFTLVIYKDVVIAYETRADIDRGVTESSSEPVLRGPKDSFGENYNKNIGLIRKRIKSKDLFLNEFDIGDVNNNKVGVMYLNSICDKDILNSIKSKLNDLVIDGVLDTNYFCELLGDENKSIFPTIMCSEKPDDVCRALMNGKIIITMENSPSILIVPTLFIDFFHSSEDYYRKPLFVTFVRIIRIIAFFITILTPGFYIAVTTHDFKMLPTSLLINFATQRSGVPFPTFVEAFILLLAFEILYEGDSRNPSQRGTSLSVLGALILGEAAVSAGLISPIMVIVVAITNISGLLFIYYDMQSAIRFWRYLIIFLSILFGIVGFIDGIILMLINMSSITSFGKPYLIPFSPFYKNGQDDAIIRKYNRKVKNND